MKKLVKILFSFILALTLIGPFSTTKTVVADNTPKLDVKVLIYTNNWSYSYGLQYVQPLVNYYEGLRFTAEDGSEHYVQAEVTTNDSVLANDKLHEEYSLIFIVVPSVNLDKYADNLMNYTNKGGRLVMVGEHKKGWIFADEILTSLAKEMGIGFNFVPNDTLLRTRGWLTLNPNSRLITNVTDKVNSVVTQLHIDAACEMQVDSGTEYEVVASSGVYNTIVDMKSGEGYITAWGDVNNFELSYCRLSFPREFFFNLLGTSYENIQAHLHNWNDGELTTEPTCETRGEITYTCQGDDDNAECRFQKTVEIAALGHNYEKGEMITPVTCETDGVRRDVCSRDRSHTLDVTISKLGHKYVEESRVEATCDEDGVIHYVCENDLTHTKNEVIKKTDLHNWNANDICTVCGEERSEGWDIENANLQSFPNIGHGMEVSEAEQLLTSTYVVVNEGLSTRGKATYASLISVDMGYDGETFEQDGKEYTATLQYALNGYKNNKNINFPSNTGDSGSHRRNVITVKHKYKVGPAPTLAYDLYIAKDKGTTPFTSVTSVNKDNILSDDDATATFNPRSNVLTLNNYKGGTISYSGNKTLYINVIGDCKIIDGINKSYAAKGYGIISSKAPVVITGEGTLTINSDKEAIYATDDSNLYDVSVTLPEFVAVTANEGAAAIKGKNVSLEVLNLELSNSNTKDVYTVFDYNGTDNSPRLIFANGKTDITSNEVKFASNFHSINSSGDVTINANKIDDKAKLGIRTYGNLAVTTKIFDGTSVMSTGTLNLDVEKQLILNTSKSSAIKGAAVTVKAPIAVLNTTSTSNVLYLASGIYASGNVVVDCDTLDIQTKTGNNYSYGIYAKSSDITINATDKFVEKSYLGILTDKNNANVVIKTGDYDGSSISICTQKTNINNFTTSDAKTGTVTINANSYNGSYIFTNGTVNINCKNDINLTSSNMGTIYSGDVTLRAANVNLTSNSTRGVNFASGIYSNGKVDVVTKSLNINIPNDTDANGVYGKNGVDIVVDGAIVDNSASGFRSGSTLNVKANSFNGVSLNAREFVNSYYYYYDANINIKDALVLSAKDVNAITGKDVVVKSSALTLTSTGGSGIYANGNLTVDSGDVIINANNSKSSNYAIYSNGNQNVTADSITATAYSGITNAGSGSTTYNVNGDIIINSKENGLYGEKNSLFDVRSGNITINFADTGSDSSNNGKVGLGTWTAATGNTTIFCGDLTINGNRPVAAYAIYGKNLDLTARNININGEIKSDNTGATAVIRGKDITINSINRVGQNPVYSIYVTNGLSVICDNLNITSTQNGIYSNTKKQIDITAGNVSIQKPSGSTNLYTGITSGQLNIDANDVKIGDDRLLYANAIKAWDSINIDAYKFATYGGTQAIAYYESTNTYSRTDKKLYVADRVKVSAGPLNSLSELQLIDDSTGKYATVQDSNYKVVKTEGSEHKHVYTLVERVEPTCDQPGISEYLICAVEGCGTTISEPTIIPALGHNWDEGVVTTVPTCSTKGVMTYTCKNDPGVNNQGEKNPAHTKTVVLPKDDENHSYTSEVILQPTCDTDGVIQYTCEHDQSHTYTEVLPALGHEWFSYGFRKATCGSGAAQLFMCLNEEDNTIEENISGPSGHHWDKGVVTTEATCTTSGLLVHTCLNDAEHTYEVVIPALGHNFVNGVCTRCEGIYGVPELSYDSSKGLVTLLTHNSVVENVRYGLIDEDVVGENDAEEFISASWSNFTKAIAKYTTSTKNPDRTTYPVSLVGRHGFRVKYLDQNGAAQYVYDVFDVTDNTSDYGVPRVTLGEHDIAYLYYVNVVGLNNLRYGKVTSEYITEKKITSEADVLNAVADNWTNFCEATGNKYTTLASAEAIEASQYKYALTESGYYIFRTKYQDKANSTAYKYDVVYLAADSTYGIPTLVQDATNNEIIHVNLNNCPEITKLYEGLAKSDANALAKDQANPKYYDSYSNYTADAAKSSITTNVTTNVDLTLKPNGTHIIRVKYIDKCGNDAYVSGVFVVDGNDPTYATLKINGTKITPTVADAEVIKTELYLNGDLVASGAKYAKAPAQAQYTVKVYDDKGWDYELIANIDTSCIEYENSLAGLQAMVDKSEAVISYIGVNDSIITYEGKTPVSGLYVSSQATNKFQAEIDVANEILEHDTAYTQSQISAETNKLSNAYNAYLSNVQADIYKVEGNKVVVNNSTSDYDIVTVYVRGNKDTQKEFKGVYLEDWTNFSKDAKYDTLKVGKSAQREESVWTVRSKITLHFTSNNVAINDTLRSVSYAIIVDEDTVKMNAFNALNDVLGEADAVWTLITDRHLETQKWATEFKSVYDEVTTFKKDHSRVIPEANDSIVYAYKMREALNELPSIGDGSTDLYTVVKYGNDILANASNDPGASLSDYGEIELKEGETVSITVNNLNQYRVAYGDFTAENTWAEFASVPYSTYYENGDYKPKWNGTYTVRVKYLTGTYDYLHFTVSGLPEPITVEATNDGKFNVTVNEGWSINSIKYISAQVGDINTGNKNYWPINLTEGTATVDAFTNGDHYFLVNATHENEGTTYEGNYFVKSNADGVNGPVVHTEPGINAVGIYGDDSIIGVEYKKTDVDVAWDANTPGTYTILNDILNLDNFDSGVYTFVFRNANGAVVRKVNLGVENRGTQPMLLSLLDD